MSREYPIQQSCMMASHSSIPYDVCICWVTLCSSWISSRPSKSGHLFLPQSAVYHYWHFWEGLEKNYLLFTSKYKAFLSTTIIPISSQDLEGLRKWIFPPLFQLNHSSFFSPLPSLLFYLTTFLLCGYVNFSSPLLSSYCMAVLALFSTKGNFPSIWPVRGVAPHMSFSLLDEIKFIIVTFLYQ